MKMILEIPDLIFRRAKTTAAKRGIPLREFVTEAVKDKLAADAKTSENPGSSIWQAEAFAQGNRARQPYY